MCGRKTLFSSSQTIKKQFNIDKWEHEKEYNPSINIAPTLESQVIVYKKQPTIKQMRWGFGFVKGYKSLFNARIETLNKKISFRNLINGHRCIVISDGYYEWKSIDGNPNLAYGLKCKISDPQEILQRSNKRLILALKTKPNYCVYEFSMSVPSISM